MERMAEASSNFKARSAGVFYVLAVITAVFGEFIIRSGFGIATIVILISCYIALTLFIYSIFKPVNRGFSLLAVCLGLMGLIFEALRFQLRHVNIGRYSMDSFAS